MSRERGTGHLLSQRKGGGTTVSAYGGSLSLTDAALRNVHLDQRLRRDMRSRDAEVEKATRKNYGRRLSLRQEILRLQHGHRKLHHLDGHLRHKAASHWDANLQMKQCVLPAGQDTLSMDLPFLTEKDKAVCSESGSLPDLTHLDYEVLAMLEAVSDDELSDFEILKSGSVDNLQHLSYVVRDKVPSGVRGPCACELSLHAGLESHTGVQRSQSSTGLKDNVPSAKTSTQEKLNSRTRKTGQQAQPLMYRRKSRSMSDLKEMFPKLGVQDSMENLGQNDHTQSLENLVAAVKKRKEKYKLLSENQGAENDT